MFRIDAICDRISFQSDEHHESIECYIKSSDQLREEFLISALKNDIENNRKKIIKLLSSCDHDNNVELLGTVMKIINERYEQEKIHGEVGVATNLMAIFVHLLNTTPAIHISISKIISENRHEKIRRTFDELLTKHQLIVMKFLEIIGKFFETICEFNGEFFIDTNCNSINKSFHSLQLQQVILIVHQLLSNGEIARYVKQKIFVDFKLSPSFIQYLKMCLNNLTL